MHEQLLGKAQMEVENMVNIWYLRLTFMSQCVLCVCDIVLVNTVYVFLSAQSLPKMKSVIQNTCI